jgi:hypothetical protein
MTTYSILKQHFLFDFFIYQEVSGHGRVMEPVSRASMWRKGFNNPPDYDDTAGFCGGFQVFLF